MPIGNELFTIVNNWLGWGDPCNGLWFIGMEEGKVFDRTVSSRKGKKYDIITSDKKNDWDVATSTAKVVTKLVGHHDLKFYRDNVMWRKSSRVFNGNLLPVGKPKIVDWPSKQYKDIFNIDHKEYIENLRLIKNVRYNNFIEFRQKMQPQAIVCFGKDLWPDFTEAFVSNHNDITEHEELNVSVFESDRVILTGHFSYGRWFPNRAVDLVVKTLSEWGVSIPSPHNPPSELPHK